MPGKVVSVHAAAGQQVKAGDLLLTLEAITAHHRISATTDGTVVQFNVSEGAEVEAGTVLVVMDGDPNG